MEQEKMKRILLVQLKRLGDAILVLPVVAGLRRAYPHAEIVMVVDPVTASLAEVLPVDMCISPQRDGWRAWAFLWKTSFDLCLDFSGTDRSAFVTFLSGATKKMTFQRFRKKPLRSWIYHTWVDASVQNLHTVDYHKKFLDALGIVREETGQPSLKISPSLQHEVEQQFPFVSKPFIIIHPGSARPEKYWKAERWAEVIRHLRDRWGLECMLTGSADKHERAHIQDILRMAGCGKDGSGKLSLSALAALIQRAVLLCGVDSAPLHFCDALGTPCLGLFGPTNPFHWHPLHVPTRIVQAGQETDVMHPRRQGHSMEEISSAQVIQKLDSLMEEIKGRPMEESDHG